MTTTTQIIIRQGQDYEDWLRVADADGISEDLTGYDALMQVRARADAAPMLTLTPGAGLTLGGIAGTINRAMSNAQTASLPIGEWPYDLVIKSPGNVRTYIDSGVLVVKARSSQMPT